MYSQILVLENGLMITVQGKDYIQNFKTSTTTIRKVNKLKISLQWVITFNVISLGVSLLIFS